MSSYGPLISVIVRVYNAKATIRRAIDSALNQTLDRSRYEVLVVDDGSTDATSGIIENEYSGFVRLVKQQHLGAKTAVRTGIRESAGTYIIFLDSDDEFLPGTLEKMLSEFEKDKSADLVYCDYFEKGPKEEKRVFTDENILSNLWCNMMFKKEVLKEVPLAKDEVFFGEYDFLIRFMKEGKIAKHIAEPLYRYYRGEGTMTSDGEKVEKGMQQLRDAYGENITEKIRKY